MADFEKSYKRLEKWEGGYANVESDKGGETYKGISRKHHPNNDIFKRIEVLKANGFTTTKQINEELAKQGDVLALVKLFYKKEFWNVMKLDEVEYQDFACNLFLLSVNAGIKRAVKVGQEACSILVDGVYGKQTLEAFKKAGQKETLLYTEIEIKYYEGLARVDASQKKFLNGWIKRAKAI